MKHLIIALIATVGFGHSVTTKVLPGDELVVDGMANFYQMLLELQAVPLHTKPELKAKYRMWNMLCFELRDVDCTGMPVPKVKKFAANPLRPGLAGYYDGSDTVYIRRDIMGAAREEVLAHEFSHYADVQLGITNVPGFAEEICFSEKRAWAVSDNYWIKYGRPSLAVGTTWTEWYKHCTPYQSVLYPDVYGE